MPTRDRRLPNRLQLPTARSLRPHPVLFRHLQLLQLQPRSVRRRLKARYVDALLARSHGQAGQAGRRSAADTIYFGGGTPSLLEPAEVARIIAACREAFDVAADAEVTLEANPETVDRGAARGVPATPASIVSVSACSRSATTNCGGCRGCTAPIARARRVGEARARRLRQRQPRSDDVAARAAASSQWLESVDAAIALGARAPVALPARGVSERAAQGRHGARPLVAGARRRRGGDVPGRRWSGSRRPATSSTRSRTSRGPGRRSRHNLKYWTDGEWLGFGCGAHSTRGRRPLEECLGHRGLHRVHRGRPYAGGRRPPADRRRAPRRRAVHRPAA